MMVWFIYQNKRNSNKFVEVRKYACGHYTAVQFLAENVNGKRNYNGSFKPYRMRVRKSSLKYVLDADYTLIAFGM